ncbi:hypothetical protein ACFWSK_17575, partial [Streptomyces sp. NPDC058620]
MSRETDSSSSGPQGRGGAAYPSGTPPYGSRQYPSLHPSQDGPEATPDPVDPPRPEEPRTETTLTTRIRINIPGSRPIPPVVMRTPMGDGDTSGGRPDAERTGSTPRPGAATPPAAANGAGSGQGADGRDGGASGEPPADKPAREKSGSDWFAPRKAPTTTSVAASSGTPAEGSGPAPTPPRADLPYFSDVPRRAGDQGAPRPGGSALDGLGAEAPGGAGGPGGQGGPG